MSEFTIPRVAMWADPAGGGPAAKTILVGTSREAARHHVADHIFAASAAWVGRVEIRINGEITDRYTRAGARMIHEDMATGALSTLEPRLTAALEH